MHLAPSDLGLAGSGGISPDRKVTGDPVEPQVVERTVQWRGTTSRGRQRHQSEAAWKGEGPRRPSVVEEFGVAWSIGGARSSPDGGVKGQEGQRSHHEGLQKYEDRQGGGQVE